MLAQNIIKTCLLPLYFLALINLSGCEYIIGRKDKPDGGDTTAVVTVAGDWLSVNESRYKEFTTFDTVTNEIVITCLQKIGDFWVETELGGVWRAENQVLYVKNAGDDDFQVIWPYRISGDTLIISTSDTTFTRHIRSDVAAFKESLDEEIHTIDYSLVGTTWSLLPEMEDSLGFGYDFPFHVVFGSTRYIDTTYANRSWYADTLASRLFLLGLDLACNHSYCGYDPPSIYELDYGFAFAGDKRTLVLRVVDPDDGTLGPADEWALVYDHFGSQAMAKLIIAGITRFGDFLDLKIK
ncbi:MAG: hypothetical protein LBC70_02925 [Chitinispirillales bacterium]|jgi:hypothetical protein|nr:hypothetical protein [Chitinispirillales bacterium]